MANQFGICQGVGRNESADRGRVDGLCICEYHSLSTCSKTFTEHPIHQGSYC